MERAIIYRELLRAGPGSPEPTANLLYTYYSIDLLCEQSIKERSCHLQLKGKRMVFSEVEFQRKFIKQLIWQELTYKSEISLFGCLPNNPLIVVYNL